MAIYKNENGTLSRKDASAASQIGAVDTENILGGGAGAQTNTQAMLDALALGGGGGGTSNYDALSNRPQINGNTLTGNKTGANLGLVDAVTGKGLSTNDYTDADKAIVGGVTTALAGKVNTTSVGVANGIAELDATGKVPSSELPSYVDDVVDGYYKEADGKFYADSAYTTEITGEAGKIYISLDTNIQYRWTGSAFSALGGALVLGETSSTAYRGDRGKIAYDFSQDPYTSTPAMDGTASAGSSTKWSRGDHVHPSDTTKADKASGATSGHFAGLDANGNLTDSGKAPSDIPTPLTAQELQAVKDAFNPSVAPVKTTYSTAEQEVGTWIDGRKVYEITVNATLAADPSTTQNLSVGIGANVVDQIISLDGMYRATGTAKVWNPMFFYDGTYYGCFGYRGDNDTIWYRSNVSNMGGQEAIFVIRYTKASV